MIKFFRKIRYDLIGKNKTGKYLKYAIGEIVLVVIGILIAISINNWKQSIDLKKVEQNLCNDLIQELQNDLFEIQGNRIFNTKYLLRYKYASEIIINDTLKKLTDTLGTIATEIINFSDFKNEESAYNKLATSGKLELITNKEILGRLQNLGVLYNYINRLEVNQEQIMFTIVPKTYKYLRLKPFQVMQPKELYDYKFHNDIELLIKVGIEKNGLYDQGEKDILALISLLEKELI